MKLFLSWSGPTSKQIASNLRMLVSDVFPDVVPWMSAHDIEAGSRWNFALDNELGESNIGILCLTVNNLRAPWLLFEAGSLAKHPQTAIVIPYLYDVIPADVPSPLSMFQGVIADRAGTMQILEAVNQRRSAPFPADKLRRSFEKWWPEFENLHEALGDIAFNEERAQTDRDILGELQQRVRGLSESVYGLHRVFDTDPISRVFRIISEVEATEASMVQERLENARKAADADWPGAASAQFWLNVAEYWLASEYSRHSNKTIQNSSSS